MKERMHEWIFKKSFSSIITIKTKQTRDSFEKWVRFWIFNFEILCFFGFPSRDFFFEQFRFRARNGIRIWSNDPPSSFFICQTEMDILERKNYTKKSLGTSSFVPWHGGVLARAPNKTCN